MGRSMKSFVRAVAAVGVAAIAASAWAQDYTVTTGTGRLEARPAGATQLTISSQNGAGSGFSTGVTLPFEFRYYGGLYTTATIAASGCIVPGRTTAIGGSVMDNNSPHGQDTTSGAFPYSLSGSGGSGAQNVNGIIAPFWAGLAHVNDGSANPGFVYIWTSGSAPTRHFVVSWENVGTYNPTPVATIQVHLYEGTDRVVFAYSTGASYTGSSYVCGLDSPNDNRYTVPSSLANSRSNTGYPGSDFVFDPRVVSYTGTLLYDKIVSDASGIGNSVLANRPLDGFRVELRNAGVVASETTTASNGSFTIVGAALPTSAVGSLAVLAQNSACRASTSGATPTTEWVVSSSLAFSANANIGTVALGAGADATASIRSAFNAAHACMIARDWAVARTADAISPVELALDDSISLPSEYVSISSIVRVGGQASANPDAWDDGVVVKTYARHVLKSIAGPQPTAYDYRFDAVTDPYNAFAEGFGCYLWAAVSGASTLVDGKSSNSGVTYDLEHPTITVAKGSDVAGCVAAGLYDLLDPANETSDAVDGTLAPEKAFHVVDTMAVAPTADTFVTAWTAAGYDGPSVVRTLIGERALTDDALEPNDSTDEPTQLGSVGAVRKNLVLNRLNDDWFSVTLAAAAPSLIADATYDHASFSAVIALEIRDAAGALVATGTPVGSSGRYHATTGSVVAGTYKIGVRHVSGVTIPSYSVQSYLTLDMPTAPLLDWTVGRDYDVPLGVVGGIPPFAVTTPSSSMPAGLGPNSTTLHASGRPTTPGTQQVTVQVKDDGDPANLVQRTQTVTIHDVFKLPIAPFVGFPAGKSVDATLPTHEGTPPFTLTMSSGALPAGLSFAPNSLHVTGTASLGPSTQFSLDGVDVAGSADHVAERAVVAVAMNGKKTPADLALQTDACGWWFDAVEGSTMAFTAATAKGRAKRGLSGTLLAPDRRAVLGGRGGGGTGLIVASKLVCPLSGRYYFVALATDNGPATQLLGTATVKLPKSGKGLNKTFAPSATTTIEFGAVPGSTATVKFAGDKRATLVAKVVSVTDPNGVAIPGVTLATLIKPTPTGGTLTLPLPVGGTWKVVLGATSTTGTPGKLTYSYALKQLKGALYSAE
jgi:hypothetical protein